MVTTLSGTQHVFVNSYNKGSEVAGEKKPIMSQCIHRISWVLMFFLALPGIPVITKTCIPSKEKVVNQKYFANKGAMILLTY